MHLLAREWQQLGVYWGFYVELSLNGFRAKVSCKHPQIDCDKMTPQQALGDVFSVRLAVNIASDKAIGNLEFGCKHLGSKRLVLKSAWQP